VPIINLCLHHVSISQQKPCFDDAPKLDRKTWHSPTIHCSLTSKYDSH